MKFRIRFDDAQDKKYGRLTAIDFTADPGRTIQEPKEDADINILMKRMGVKDGSALPHFSNPKAMYGDFSEMPSDPVEIAAMMRAGELAYLRLPAELRQRYQTPEQLFNFMNNNENYDEAVKLGLLEKREEPRKGPLEALGDKIDTLVSSSTSSDKEPLVKGKQTKPEKE